jgi:membrane protease YdiL (CAAX protease family)
MVEIDLDPQGRLVSLRAIPPAVDSGSASRPIDWNGLLQAAGITGNLSNALLALLIVWTFAAFGEEFSYRGYLLSRAAAIGGGSAAAHWAAVVAVSVLFGFGHYYKGPAGVLDSGVAGLILGAAYMLSGRNLWAPILEEKRDLAKVLEAVTT